ncbi:uncharacterized protein [Chlorocebus sabaeus]|uniref:uncharacterized protein n=1 Tax=Chlorocebus sabaeus TaxID=60711 RepID=UPI003BF9E27A
MAAQGPKSGGCGEGLAGVLLCRAVGLERLHHWTLEARKETHTLRDSPGAAVAPSWERTRGWRGRSRELLPTGSCRRREQTRPSPLSNAKPGRAELGCWGSAPRALPCPFGGGQLPACCSPATVRPAAPGCAQPAPRAAPGTPAVGPTLALRRLDKLPSSRAPAPSRLTGGSLAGLLWAPAGRACSLPLSNPEPLAPSRPQAAAPTKPEARRRPGEGLGVAAETLKPEGGVPSAGRVQWEGAAGM